MEKETMEVGKKLVDFCKRGENMKAVESLYDSNIESIEAEEMPNYPAQMRGIENIKRKNKDWAENNVVHAVEVEGPFPAGDRFAVLYKFDATNKKSNQKMHFEEVALYSVKDGKIVKEEFFYSM
ncbi:nuclear transport factor 2 family protein [Bdellovibrio reynosensis]|uniref:Nuclear transport factor 2 family protein n=1 Tax=Bdellovibrio reynosensis TaxID=2835041 RepID=A0ABY4CG50_9BACT|nr:nuclear transport factor 2 family protein [Bdellovibrio reynosensis]UOF02533.1 nuclear transport factor 2 family protein [Bdellovibrio reynosensis]